MDAAKAALEAKFADATAQAPALLEFMLEFVGFVRTTFGNSPDILADFGLKPKKAKRSLTTDQQAVAVAKRASTREARGTKGKRAKLAIHGDVTGVVVTPVTSGSGTK